MLTTPTDAFFPNSVPWGPFRTSMWSTSIRLMKAWPGRARTTLSTTVETSGSVPGDVVMVPRPRISIAWSLAEPWNRYVNDGICIVTSERFAMFAASIWVPDMTATETGIESSGSERRVAVTSTGGSSKIVLSSLDGAAAGFCASSGRAPIAVRASKTPM